MTSEPVGLDKHDPAGMAAWLCERERVALEFMKLSSEEQIRAFLQDWQRNVLPHLAFRFRQAAEMIERLSKPAHEREPPHCSTCECQVEGDFRG